MSTLPPHPADFGLVSSLARLLTKLVSDSNCSVGVVTLFHAVNEPNITIAEYISRISKYAGCSTECFVLCIVYIDRILKNHKNFIVSVLNIHRLVITSIMIAAKFYDDLYYSNSFYAKIGGVKTTEINLLEAHFLSLIGFDLFVSGSDYEICRSKIANSECWAISSVYPRYIVDQAVCPKNSVEMMRMDTVYQNDTRTKYDNKPHKMQQAQSCNNWGKDKYQYNIARYNDSFRCCDYKAMTVPSKSVYGNLSTLSLQEFHPRQHQPMNHYYSYPATGMHGIRSHPLHRMNMQHSARSNSYPICPSGTSACSMYQRQQTYAQNSHGQSKHNMAVKQHRNHILPFHCRPQHNHHICRINNNVGGYCNKPVRREFDCWNEKNNERGNFMALQVPAHPIPILCHSFQTYNY